MILTLKSLVIALAAALALGAVLASAAWAQQGVLTSEGPVTLVGTEVGGPGANAVTAFGASIECPGSIYTGHKAEVTPHELIPSGATKGTLTPHFKSCTESGGLPVTVDMNGCDLIIEGGETIEAGKYSGTGSLLCPLGKSVQATVFSSGSHALKLCTISAGAQGGSGAATLTNTAGGVKVSGTITGVSGAKSGLCGSGSTSEGQIHFSAEVEGLNSDGEPTEISVSD
ncbi:MAG TPA: hypothetical protein VFM94_09390 [Solirubrobacterales bacterium]|nr:hypothetical protein [Solirubrobacterales bacterium]